MLTCAVSTIVNCSTSTEPLAKIFLAHIERHLWASADRGYDANSVLRLAEAAGMIQ